MTEESLREEIVRKVAELSELEPEEVEDDRPLKELGIDSLMAIELVVFVEKLIQRRFPEERVGAIRTCADVLREAHMLLQGA